MPLSILNNLLRSARDAPVALLSSSGLQRFKTETFRNLLTQTELKSQDDNNSAPNGGSASLRRSLTRRKEEWEMLGGSEQVERVINYYKSRSAVNDTGNVTTQSALDAVDDDPSQSKSLYNLWATRKTRDVQSSPKGPLKPIHDFAMSSANDPFRHQKERIISAMSRPAEGGEDRERSLNRLRRPLSAPVTWLLDKSPLNLLSNEETRTIDPRKRQEHSRSSKTKNMPVKSNFKKAVSEDDFILDNEDDEESTAEDESKSDNVKHRHEKNQVRASTATTRANHVSPDDIPLFDVGTLKKQYFFGGRLGMKSLDRLHLT